MYRDTRTLKSERFSLHKRWSLILILFLSEFVTHTYPEPQYTGGGRVPPPYDVQHQDQGQNGYQGGYQDDQNGYNRNRDGYQTGQNGYRDGQNGYRDGQNGYPDGQNGYGDRQNSHRDGQNGYRDDQTRFRGNPNGYPDDPNFQDGAGNPINRRLGDHVATIRGAELRALLQRVDVMLSHQCTKNVASQWEFETNVNPATQQAAVSFQFTIIVIIIVYIYIYKTLVLQLEFCGFEYLLFTYLCDVLYSII